MQVVVDSLLTHYIRAGKGKTVVILHGWADSSSSFRGLCAFLSKYYDVIVLDLPGFGTSAHPKKDAWSLYEYANFIEHFLVKVGVPQVWSFIGHSNGGSIAIRGLAQDNLRAEKLVLLASAGVRNVHSNRNRVLRIITKTGKLLTMPLPASAKKSIRGKLYKTIGSDMLVAENMQETYKRIVNDDVRADAAQLTLPVLLIYGENDTETPVWHAEQFRQLLPNSMLEILPGAGHFVHLDRPTEVQYAIQEFLQ